MVGRRGWPEKREYAKNVEVQNIEHTTYAILDNAALHRSSECNKMVALGYVNTREDKLRTRSNAVLIGLAPVPRYSPFTSLCKSSYGLRSIGVPRRALGARKNLVGITRRRIIIRII